ncbi:MAG: LLM class flavin-dependent oxidoreductase [Clostridia bacterium]|nr:LLM class flavin-dependent oxidoreductase [Clostridia bacterium]
MPPVEFGITLSADRDVASFARRAEELGFDYLACGEHVMFHGPTANALVVLSAAAGATERVRLLSSVALLPLYPAALLAKMASMLDVVSGGRFELGVGVGGEFPKEFEACGVPVAERGARANEALQVVDRLLREENVSFEGRFNRLSGVTLLPRPVQTPRPPIWVAGRREAAMRRAARYADGWMPYMFTPEQLADSLERIGRYAKEYGREGRPVRGAVFTFVTVDRDAGKAKRTAAEFVGAMYRQDFSRLVDRYLVAGSPADCRRRLGEYRDAGAQLAVFTLACPREEREDVLRALVEEVLPDLR